MVRRFPVPRHENGQIIITYPDGREETISLLTASVQAEVWSAAIHGATIFYATMKDEQQP